jgi:hypothetical protein
MGAVPSRPTGDVPDFAAWPAGNAWRAVPLDSGGERLYPVADWSLHTRLSLNSWDRYSFAVAEKRQHEHLNMDGYPFIPAAEVDYPIFNGKEPRTMRRRPSPIYSPAETNGAGNGRPRPLSKRIVFGWYGGKFSHLNWLLPLLPGCHHYCEPFAGSAAVLLNRQPSPVETYNDMDGEVVNFFRVLRHHKDQLIEAP